MHRKFVFLVEKLILCKRFIDQISPGNYLDRGLSSQIVQNPAKPIFQLSK